jgi:predicted  nucleic acid-binding Zn-ribbon protein
MEYAYQKRYRGCGHTIHSFGWDERTDAQFEACDQPLVYLEGECQDCRARQNIGDSNINFLITSLRTQINGYVEKMQEFNAENKQLKTSITKKDYEIRKIRDQSEKYRAAWTKVLATNPGEEQDGELRTHHQEKEDHEAEIVKLRKTISQQDQALGTLRKRINESKESPTENNLALKNTSTLNLQALGPPQQNLTENSLAAQSLNLQETAREKKFKLIATMGYINPITSGFNTLQQGLEEHVWWPFVKSLLSELQEAVRRNNWEEICDIHDRLQSFAVAFDNDLKERVENVEQEIVKQCEQGVQRLLGAIM